MKFSEETGIPFDEIIMAAATASCVTAETVDSTSPRTLFLGHAEAAPGEADWPADKIRRMILSLAGR